MSALPAPTPIREIMPAPGPLDSNQWAGLEEAAVALHRDPAHLRRLCREQLERRGYAKKARGQWFISRRFNLALAGGRVGEKFQTPDLKHFPAHQVKLAWKRAACVDVYRDARSNWTGTFEQLKKVLIPDLRKQYPELKVSARSLDRWYKVYDTPADIVKLIDARGGNQVGGADPAWWDHLKSIYLDQRKPSLKVCWERARDQARIDGWRACSYESCRRQLDARIPPQTRAQFRDPKSYRWNYAPYLEQNPEAWDAGCLWIGDHCQLDFHCRFGNRILRPWITVWIDWRTRRIAGFTLSDKPNSSTILAALRYGLIHDRDANMGGPDAVWIDNGKDFDSYTLQGQTKQERQAVRRIVDGFRLDHEQTYGVFSLLNIQVHFARPYNPNGKGREERWFGTLHDQFDRSFRTYCGASPDRKPEDLQNILKQPHLIPDFEHVRDRLENYIAGYNASAEHSRQDMTGWSPDAMLLAKCPRKRVMADPEALDLCLQHWHQPVRVGRNGVTIRPAGKAISYGQFNEALGRYKKTQLPLKVS